MRNAAWIVAGMLALGLAASVAVGQERGMGGIGITVFADRGFRGQNATFNREVRSLAEVRFDNRISSLRVAPGESWEVCERPDFRGQCQVFFDTESDLRRVGWDNRISSMRRARGGDSGGGGRGGGRGGGGPVGRLELFERRRFGGDSIALEWPAESLGRMSGRAESLRLSGTWEVCDRDQFRGRCILISRNVENLDDMGWKDRIRSARPR